MGMKVSGLSWIEVVYGFLRPVVHVAGRVVGRGYF